MRTTLLLSADPEWGLELARSWALDGDQPTLVLLDEAAALARPSHPLGAALAAAAEVGVVVLVHDGALRRRGLDTGAVATGVKVVTLDEVADLLVDGSDRAVWL
jgi:hypothetical protein